MVATGQTAVARRLLLVILLLLLLSLLLLLLLVVVVVVLVLVAPGTVHPRDAAPTSAAEAPLLQGATVPATGSRQVPLILILITIICYNI